MNENTLQFGRYRDAWMRMYFLLAWCIKTACIAMAIPVFLLGCAILVDVCTGFDVIVSVATLGVDQKEEFSKLLAKAGVIMGLIVVVTRLVYSPVVARFSDRIADRFEACIQRIAEEHPKISHVIKWGMLSSVLAVFGYVFVLALSGQLEPRRGLSEQPVSNRYDPSSSAVIQFYDGTTKSGTASVIKREDGVVEVRFKN
jgi:hypothetical protein